jgi:hypothetical protein
MTLDPVAMATITSAVSVLGTEYLKGVGTEAGKATWNKLKSLLGWKEDPPAEEIPHAVATSLKTSPDLAQKILELLKDNRAAGVAASMVGKIDAKNVAIIETMHGNITMK